jgi:hypothetical protein
VEEGEQSFPILGQAGDRLLVLGTISVGERVDRGFGDMAYRLSGGSDRLDTRLDTPPSIRRRHPNFHLAPREPPVLIGNSNANIQVMQPARSLTPLTGEQRVNIGLAQIENCYIGAGRRSRPVRRSPEAVSRISEPQPVREFLARDLDRGAVDA